MKRVTGEDGARARLEGLPYAQVPDAALKLSGPAYKILGRLQRLAGPRAVVEVDDQELGRAIHRTVATVQRGFRELEAAGLVERKRRGGRRRIILCYSLAGREARRDAPSVINALITRGQTSETSALRTDDRCIDHGRSMHSSELSSPLKEERREEEQQRAAAPPRDVVVSSLPREEEEAPPTRPAFLATLVADLADALTSPGAKRTAAGTSPKDPRRPR